MKPVESLLSYVVPYADGVPKFVARQAIVKAAQQFCTQTLVWQEDYSEVVVHPGKFIEAPVPPYANVLKYMQVFYDGKELVAVSRDSLGASGIDYRALEGQPRYYYQASLNTIRLVPEPEEHGVVRMTVALAPTLEAKELPDDLIQRFWPALVNGALADIKQTQGQSYSDPQAAVVYLQLFAQGVREAKNEAARSFGRGAGRVAYQRII